jgi:hypothetical protein
LPGALIEELRADGRDRLRHLPQLPSHNSGYRARTFLSGSFPDCDAFFHDLYPNINQPRGGVD